MIGPSMPCPASLSFRCLTMTDSWDMLELLFCLFHMRRQSSSRETVLFFCSCRMRKSFSSPLLSDRLVRLILSSDFGRKTILFSVRSLSQLSFSLSTSMLGRLSIYSVTPSAFHSSSCVSSSGSSDLRKIGIV